MIKIGVSSCVLGQSVRYDGGHKRSGFVVKKVDELFEMVPICPEVGMGMPVPRPTIHVREKATESGIRHRLVDTKDGTIDHTDKLNHFFGRVQQNIDSLDGYIVAAKSPTCGMERIKVYSENGDMQHRKGTGMFVALLKQHFPFLPIEEDGRLNDKGLKESFFVRVMAHNAFRERVLAEPSIHHLVQFHSDHKLLLMAYKPELYRQLGRVVANASKSELQTLLVEYQTLFMQALTRTASRKKHSNVLMHIQGYFKKQLNKSEKAELSQEIEHYRLGYVPLHAPLTLLKHHLMAYPNDYLLKQVYLQPFPLELGLSG